MKKLFLVLSWVCGVSAYAGPGIGAPKEVHATRSMAAIDFKREARALFNTVRRAAAECSPDGLNEVARPWLGFWAMAAEKVSVVEGFDDAGLLDEMILVGSSYRFDPMNEAVARVFPTAGAAGVIQIRSDRWYSLSSDEKRFVILHALEPVRFGGHEQFSSELNQVNELLRCISGGPR